MEQTILTNNQQTSLSEISKHDYLVENFYFTGGTVLSEFYYKHRLSEDLDFFTTNDYIDDIQILKFIKTNKLKTKALEVEYTNSRYQKIIIFKYKNQEPLKIDFAYFPLEHIGEFKKYKNIKFSSYQDIAVNKLNSLSERKRGRDYLDLYYILTKEKLDIKQLEILYRTKYDMYAPKNALAKAFSSVLEASDQPRFLGDIKWSKIQKFFLELSKKV